MLIRQEEKMNIFFNPIIIKLHQEKKIIMGLMKKMSLPMVVLKV